MISSSISLLRLGASVAESSGSFEGDNQVRLFSRNLESFMIPIVCRCLKGLNVNRSSFQHVIMLISCMKSGYQVVKLVR